jgi:hypothetical protein
MANRFVRRIRSGDIDSIGDLKSEFKELAKQTHPDLLAQGGQAGAETEFVAIRAEYEAALRDFEKHRFGAGSGDRRRGDGNRGVPSGRSHEGGLPDSAWLCLELLLKRGFPKVARHEKQRLRYEYARWRFEETLGEERGELFRVFESELLDLKAFVPKAPAPVLRLVLDLIEYRYEGLAALRTNIVLSYGRLKGDPRLGAGLRAFLALLAGDLGIGGELGG